MRRILPAIFLAAPFVAWAGTPGLAQTSASGPEQAFAVQSQCVPAWKDGFAEGVEAVNAQLGPWRDTVQVQVQEQVNAQLREQQSRADAELSQAIAAALEKSFAEAGQTMPVLPQAMTADPMPAASSSADAGSADAARGDSTALDAANIGPLPADTSDIPVQTSLPTGTTITILDPQNLPPGLYQSLMAYVTR